jgi:VanZ family protein
MSADSPDTAPSSAASGSSNAFERSRADVVALAWLPAILYTALIWWLSSQPIQLEGIELFPFQDKGVHFLEYGTLCLTICFAVYKTWPGRGVRSAWAAVLITTGLGLLDELHQAFVPARSSDLKDLLADFAGSLVFAFACYAALRVRASRRKVSPP